MPGAWSHALAGLAAPWQLVGQCSKRATWHTIGGAAGIIVAQLHGGLTVQTPADGQDAAATDAPMALRSLIQLDGDLLLMVDRDWFAKQEPQALKLALARHQAQIWATLEPLRRGFDTATGLLILADRSRWTVLALAGLSEAGAITLAPDFAAESLSAWLSAAAGQLEVVLLQVLSLSLVALHAGVRRLLRWWIHRRIEARLHGLTSPSHS